MDQARKWKISLYAMAAVYIVAGFNHFLNPDFYLSVMPEWLPFHQWANWVSGVAEVILGVMLIPQPTRRFAAWMIIAMLTVFFFAIHIPMCFHFYGKDDLMFWVSVIRIPLQLVLINWAWKFAKKRNERSEFH